MTTFSPTISTQLIASTRQAAAALGTTPTDVSACLDPETQVEPYVDAILALGTLRENAVAMADQLEAAGREIERLVFLCDVTMKTERDQLRVKVAKLTEERDAEISRAEAEHQRYLEERTANVALGEERDRMRPVVEAAIGSYGSQRGGHFGQPRPTNAMTELADAIDAYRAAKEKP